MGSTVAVVDADGRPRGPLEDGEIVVQGDDVFAGYLDDPAATSAVMRHGWFHTGDLGHFDADGYLVVRGRIKDMINRGGEKIAPTEVEAALIHHPAVYEAAAFALPHPTLGEEVAAAVVLRAGGRATEAEILAVARLHLAPFKLPRRIMFRAALPRGGSEKVRRAELAASCRAELEAADATAIARAPSPMEAALAALWRDVLDRGAVPLDRNFFLLGGDSLKAAALLARVDAVFGVRLEIGRMFEDIATLEAMAAAVAAASAR
ncbi:MAG: AMP-binding protein [Alphaproteobacteria bacterium]|nr:AMP-binding protein [Alphaproteobacteria bacterium]